MAIGTIAKIILFTFGCYQLFMIGICQSYFGGGVGAGGSNGYQNNRGNAWQGYRSYFEQPQQQQQPFQQFYSFVPQQQQQQNYFQTRQTPSSSTTSQVAASTTSASESLIAVAKLEGQNVQGIVQFRQMVIIFFFLNFFDIFLVIFFYS